MKAATAALLLACAGFGMALHAGQKPAATEGAPVPAGPAIPADPPRADDVARGKADIRPDVLAQVEKELARLDAQADAEDAELTQVTPSPSRAVAFYMLTGLAASASPVKDVPKDEQRIFGIDQAEGRTNGRLFAVAKDVRIAFVDKRLRDKSGWYVLRFAALYRHEDGTWAKKGWGHIIPAE